jgi:hypothetical protein
MVKSSRPIAASLIGRVGEVVSRGAARARGRSSPSMRRVTPSGQLKATLFSALYHGLHSTETPCKTLASRLTIDLWPFPFITPGLKLTDFALLSRHPLRICSFTLLLRRLDSRLVGYPASAPCESAEMWPISKNEAETSVVSGDEV